MSEANENLCGCNPCVGSSCACGCQNGVAQDTCACGADCRCEGACDQG